MARQASLLLADEIYYNLHGKAILQGIYQGDITIPGDQIVAQQLIFYFMAEGDTSEPFKSLAVEVTLPGNPSVRQFVPVMPPEFVKSMSVGRTRLFYRHPLMLQAPVLRPGKIEAKVIHDAGEIDIHAPWIVRSAPPPQPS